MKNKLIIWAAFRWLNGQAKEGTVIGQAWTWLSGKKTAAGLVITAVTKLALALPAVLALFNVDALTIGLWVGYTTTAIGLAHKAYKYIYREDFKE